MHVSIPDYNLRAMEASSAVYVDNGDRKDNLE